MEEIHLTDAVSRALAAFKPLVLTIAVIYFHSARHSFNDRCYLFS